jgi:hypothetical protein
MKKNKIKLLVTSAVITTSLLFGSISVFASEQLDNANAKVEQAVQNKTFYNYMMAYIDILNLPQDQQGELLNKLAPIWNNVNTSNVQKARAMLEKVAKDRNGKIYAETEAFLAGLSDNDMDAFTKGYLLGELTSWGRQFVFTDDYKQAVDALVNVKDHNSYINALIKIDNVSKSESKNYLYNELANYKQAYNITEPIGAPIGNELCPSGLGFLKNSADGIKVAWLANNQTGKTINYYTVNISMYNAVGDPAYDQIKRTSKISVKYVGPITANEQLVMYGVVAYSAVCETIVIDSIDLQYADGTSETILYGKSGTETLVR